MGRRHHVLSEEDQTAIIALLEDFKIPMTEISRKTGIPVLHIYRLNNKLKIRPLGTREYRIPLLQGEHHPRHTLTEKDVKKIKTLSAKGATQHTLAKLFSVNQSTINRILKNLIW